MIKALETDIDVNLQPLSYQLHQQGIDHRINEESGLQVVWVTNERSAVLVRQLAAESQSVDPAHQQKGTESTAEGRQASILTSLGIHPGVLLVRAILACRAAPVSFILVISCVIVALYTRLGTQADRFPFMFFPSLPTYDLGAFFAALVNPLVFLQSLAPMLLHFGELHIVFNLLWLWFFGRQLEQIQSSWTFLALVVFTSFCANVAQYLYTQQANFGGMSGVVYGLVGYAWILHNFVPGKQLMLRNSIFIVFVVALIAMEIFASNWVANAAHAGGLVAGLAAGVLVWISHYWARSSRR